MDGAAGVAAAGTATAHARVRELLRAARALAAGLGKALACAIRRAGASGGVGGASQFSAMAHPAAGSSGGGGGLFADEIAALTDLSLNDINALIGGEGGGGGRGAQTEFERRLEPLFAALEARVLSTLQAPAPARRGSGGAAWSVEADASVAIEPVRVLVTEVEREVAHALAKLAHPDSGV